MPQPTYLRYLADNNADPLWTMAPEFDCSEWSLPEPDAGTILALVEHIRPRTNSSVTYYDIAPTPRQSNWWCRFWARVALIATMA